MFVETEGLVIREVQIKEADKLLTILTKDMGQVTALARGAKRRGSSLVGCSQLLACARFSLFENKGRFIIDDAECIEFFVEVREDIELLSLSSYFAQLLQVLADEGVGDGRLLSLTQNSLYALGRLKKPQDMVKPVFELTALSISGFAPLVDECAVCGEENPGQPGLNITEGVLCCRDCRDQLDGGIWMPLTAGALGAMRYLLSCPPGKIFSFALDPPGLASFASACEAFLLAQTGRGFSTLDFYKSLKAPQFVADLPH